MKKNVFIVVALLAWQGLFGASSADSFQSRLSDPDLNALFGQIKKEKRKKEREEGFCKADKYLMDGDIRALHGLIDVARNVKTKVVKKRCIKSLSKAHICLSNQVFSQLGKAFSEEAFKGLEKDLIYYLSSLKIFNDFYLDEAALRGVGKLLVSSLKSLIRDDKAIHELALIKNIDEAKGLFSDGFPVLTILNLLCFQLPNNKKTQSTHDTGSYKYKTVFKIASDCIMQLNGKFHLSMRDLALYTAIISSIDAKCLYGKGLLRDSGLSSFSEKKGLVLRTLDSFKMPLKKGEEEDQGSYVKRMLLHYLMYLSLGRFIASLPDEGFGKTVKEYVASSGICDLKNLLAITQILVRYSVRQEFLSHKKMRRISPSDVTFNRRRRAGYAALIAEQDQLSEDPEELLQQKAERIRKIVAIKKSRESAQRR